ncbi:hypothetical protein GGX14DRAFT_380220, partial [Mycena pura]
HTTTNKVRYTRQMTVWLARQEATYRFGTYLQWAVPGYTADPNSASADELEDDDADDDVFENDSEGTSKPGPPPTANDSDSDDEGDFDDASGSAAYRVPKNPSFPRVPVTDIVSEFHGTDFLIKLDDFLESNSINPPIPPGENTTFPVYKRFSVPLPQISEVTSHVVYDTIQAVRGEPRKLTAKGVVPAKEGRFDTVLIHKDTPDGDHRPTDEYGSYPHPLAYVDWYKPLKTPVPNVRMHELSLSFRNHRQNSSIIPITEILRSCHLVPVFGKSANPTWTSDRVLDQCRSFYLNPYLRHHDFYLFRYLVDLYDSRKAEEQRRVRIRQFGRAGM